MSKPNKIKTLTPELDDILRQLCSEYGDVLGLKAKHQEWDGGPEHIVRQIKIAKQQLNTYYLNLFMECLPKPSTRSGNTLNADTINEDYQRGNSDGYNEHYSETLNNLKNKLGVG